MVTFLHILQIFAAIVVCGGAFVLIYQILSSVTNDDNHQKFIMGIEKQMSRRHDLSKAMQRLVRIGVTYRFKTEITPATYLLTRIVVGAIFFALAFLLSLPWIFYPIAFLLGFFGLDMYMIHKNNNDNKEMANDIYVIFTNLRVQLDANIYLLDALITCNYLVKNKRLHQALDELIVNMSSVNLTAVEAIDIFEHRFSNHDITNMAIFFKNYIIYGVTDKYINDLMGEINDMSAATALKAEADLEQKSGLLNLLFFASLLSLIMFGMMQTIDINGIFSS